MLIICVAARPSRSTSVIGAVSSAAIRNVMRGLNGFDISHFFEVYDGDQGGGNASRSEQKVLPFFSNSNQF